VTIHTYDRDFFDWVALGAARSAANVLPVLIPLAPASVLDVGCGRGTWLQQWRILGVSDVIGVDGDYVARASLVVPPECFIAHDLQRPLRLGRRFDLVESLEVAEHIPEASTDTFIDSLCAHADVILFSAAVPGQGGEFHVNEQPYSYWRAKFRARGYAMLDVVRPRVVANRLIEPWYRYNCFLFVTRDRLSTVPEEWVNQDVTNSPEVPDVSPWAWRLRKALIRRLPASAVTRLSRVRYLLATKFADFAGRP
jgi:SAM-dependent methyltransferase